MAGIKALRKIQLGREVTAGTAVVATTVWRGTGTIEDQLEHVFVQEDVGILPGTDRSYVPKVQAALNMEATPATFEQLPHILDAGIAEATPAKDGSGSGYGYTYAFPETAAGVIQTYTIEGGDDNQEEEFAYGFVQDFTLEGSAGEAWMMSANWLGRQVAASTFTGSVAIPTVEEILFSKTLLYIDAIGGSYGGTIKSSTLLAASLKVNTGRRPVYAADGQLYFSFQKQTAPEILLDVTFEHDATAAAQIVNWRAKTPLKVQLKCTGATLGTSGTAYAAKTMIINLAGRWDKFAKLGEQDGNDIVTGTFRARYNATATDIGSIVVVNELSALP